MSDIAIRVEKLSKRYRIGRSRQRHDTVREAVAAGIKRPFSRFQSPGRPALAAEETLWALKEISFEVQRGEVVGVIGHNGAGKSTLLKLLSQITEPTGGRAVLKGRVGSLLEVGTGFHPELTGRENVYLSGAILGMGRQEIERKFDQIVTFSGVQKFIDTPIKRYSSGMKVRLGFAVAAHLDPEILLVDEVLAVGDASFQKRCLGKMESIAGSGRTVLFVSHNMASVEGLCTRGLVLAGGELVFTGSQRQAIQHYLALLGSEGGQGHYLRKGWGPTGTEPARILEARVTSEGIYSEVGIPVGAPLEFRVRCHSEGRLHRPGLGIGIDNALGQRVVTLHTELDQAHAAPAQVSGEFEFICTISDLALKPDDYRLTLTLESGGVGVEAVEDALRLTLYASDYHGSGGRKIKGLVYCKQKWALQCINA